MRSAGIVKKIFKAGQQFQRYQFIANRRLNNMAETSGMDPEEPSKYSVVKEGKATIIQPSSVFYNPVQEFNRDLTIAVISEFAEEHIREVREKRRKNEEKEKLGRGEVMDNGEENDVKVVITDNSEGLEAGKPHEDGIKILEGLSASGLRSMRFGLEIPGVKQIVANDFDETAAEIIRKNIARNNLEDLVEASRSDAAMLMYQHKSFKNRFDVIDLDPYGSAAPFLDSAVQAIRDGGLLCITCTDASILCGNAGEKSFTMYGSMSLKGKFCHEMGIRIILHALESHANRYSRYIVPLISLSIDFYFRVFVRVHSGQAHAKHSASKTGMVYHCTGCGSFTTQPLGEVHTAKNDSVRFIPAYGPPVTEQCEHCGFRHQIGGPMYISKMHDKNFIERVVNRANLHPELFGTASRIKGMLSMVGEELEMPLYYDADALYNVLHCTPPKLMQVRSAILNAGYKVSFSHACKNSLKTNAPNKVIWDIMRAWVADNPINPKRLVHGTPAMAILAEKPSIEVNFEMHEDANPKSRSEGLKRWQPNPEKNWGPKPRAKKSTDGLCDTLEERRRVNQGKRKRKAEPMSGDSPPNKLPELKPEDEAEASEDENKS